MPPRCDQNKLICPYRDWVDAEIERLRAALLWMAEHDPQLVEAATKKFNLEISAPQS